MNAQVVYSQLSDRRHAISDWRRAVLWGRLAELTSGITCVLVSVFLLTLYDLSPLSAAHQWMLRILRTDEAWSAAFAVVGIALLIGASCPWGKLRNICLALGIFFFGGVAVAAIYAHAMPVSSAFFVANAWALSVTFVLGPRKGLG